MPTKPDPSGRIVGWLLRLPAIFFAVMTLFSLLVYSGNWFVSKDDLNMEFSDLLMPAGLSGALFLAAGWISRER